MLGAEFTSRRDAKTQAVRNSRNISRTQVLTAAALDLTATSATVLVVADQRVSDTLPLGRIDRQRIGATERSCPVNGRWLVDDFGSTERADDGCADVAATAGSDALLRQSCSAIERLFSFDYRTLEAAFAAQHALVADDALIHDEPGIRRSAVEEHVSVTAKVSNAAVERQAPSTATVLAYLVQDVKNDTRSTPRIDRNRLQVTLTKVDGRRLITKIQALEARLRLAPPVKPFAASNP